MQCHLPNSIHKNRNNQMKNFKQEKQTNEKEMKKTEEKKNKKKPYAIPITSNKSTSP
jgi:hypothetical protein